MMTSSSSHQQKRKDLVLSRERNNLHNSSHLFDTIISRGDSPSCHNSFMTAAATTLLQRGSLATCRRKLPSGVFPSTNIITTSFFAKRSMKYLVDPPVVPTVPVKKNEDVGQQQQQQQQPTVFPVHRIYCVGRNYADHVKEMGGDAKKDSPMFFCKPADAVLPCAHYDTMTTPTTTPQMVYPLDTENLHHEVELVLAIGKSGTYIPMDQAMEHVVAYGVGLDLTRRDRQSDAKKSGGPWDVAKALDHGAPISDLVPACSSGGGLAVDARIWCKVNGETKQDAQLNQMIWSNAEIIHHLSARFELQPGDLIYTGTPAGVGPLVAGDVVEAGIDGLPPLKLEIVERSK